MLHKISGEAVKVILGENILVVFVKAACKCKASIYLKIAALNKNLWELVIMRHL